MKKMLFDFLSDDKDDARVSDNKLIVFLTFLFATGVLFYATYKDHAQLDVIFVSYCLIFSGLKVSKGIIDTMQQRKEKE